MAEQFDALTQEQAAVLRALVIRDGVVRVAARIGSSRLALVNALAGLPTRRGTIALIVAALNTEFRAAA